MLRRLVVITAALGLSLGSATAVMSQDIILGGEAGLNLSNVSTEIDVFGVKPGSRTGFWGGLFADFGVASWFHLRPEVLFSAKGFKVVDPILGGQARLRANYVQIPLLLEAVIPVSNSPLRPLVFFGPAFSFETKCSVDGSGGLGLISSPSVDCDAPLVEIERKKTDFSLIFGGELGFTTGKVVPFLGVRYDLGLTNLDDSDLGVDSVKNRTWTFYVGLGVPVGSSSSSASSSPTPAQQAPQPSR